MKTTRQIRAAMSALNINTLRKFQIEPINSLLNKHDTFVIAPTSSGKSAIFQIPALVNAQKGKWTLVIEPTVSLIEDQVNKLRSLGIPAAALTRRNATEHDAILDRLSNGKLSILYVTPERFQSEDFQNVVCDKPPWLIVVDEAHCVLDWGYTFRPDYLRIKDFLKKLKHRPVIAVFTATAPPEYRDDIIKCLGMKKPDLYVHSLARPNIIILEETFPAIDTSLPKKKRSQAEEKKLNRRLARVNYNIKKYGREGRVVVYCATRKNVDLVANYLSGRYPGEVVKCHGFMNIDKREKHELQFINGSRRIMVATTAFGMGIDAPNIRLVVHFDLPLSVIDYYQQIGRAGRDGQKSHAVLLYDPDGVRLNEYILKKEDYSKELRKRLSARLDEMVSIAESHGCLMRQVLEQLGEAHPNKCRHCTNCQRARR